MNLYTALSIVRNAAARQSEPSTQLASAIKVVDRKLVGLERKMAWRETEQGTIPRHMFAPRQTIPDCAAQPTPPAVSGERGQA
jgi:hypothetical protein